MKKQLFGISLSSVFVLLLVLLPMSIMTIGSAGLPPASSAGSPASLLDNCIPAAGVVIQAPYSSGYVACASGTLTGLPGGIGAITFKHGDPNTLLVATYTETSSGVIYAVPVHRDSDNHIIDFPNPGAPYASAAYVSTGMAYGPGNVLFYSRAPVNELGEVKPGSVWTDRVIGLTTLGVTPAVSGINFVPSGFPHEGELKLVTNKQAGEWYAATLSPEGDGTYSVAAMTKKTTISSYPEGFVYVPPESPQFPDYRAMLVGEYYSGAISAYSLDSESNPVPASRSTFLTGLPWVQGSAIDPVTGDLIIATRGARVIAVRGFGTQPWVPTPTPTATTTPPAMYSITGRVTNSDNVPVYNVKVDCGGVVWSYTDSGGYYYCFGLPAGTYYVTASRPGMSIWPAGYSVTVPPDATRDFTTQKLIGPPPVILVHGYLGISGPSDKCEYGVERWEQAMFPHLFDELPQWLHNDGFEVWIAHWDSAPVPGWTAPLETSGKCLANHIATVRQKTGQSKVILIAHSMGGPVSRAYLQSSTYAAQNDVQTLITLGSPHAGISGLTLLRMVFVGPLAAYCILQPAFCQMDPTYMALFNLRNESNDVNYTLIGGDGGGGPLAVPLYAFNGSNDGLAGLASANGKYWTWFGTMTAVRHPVTRYRTHEDHLPDWGTWYFEPRPGQTLSDSYKCIREILLGLNRADCPVAPPAPARVQEEGSPYALAPKQSGHISTGETISRTLSIDTTDLSVFTLTWVTQTLSLALVNPNGVTIDPPYAMSNPSTVTFDSGPAGNGWPGWMTYTFTNTVPGVWTLGVSAPDAGPDGTDWAALVAFEASRTLEVGADAALYGIGDTATLTATLKSGTIGIAGATVQVDLARSDNVTDTLTLTDMGGGHYQGPYNIPDAPGYVEVIFTANGDDGGTAFSRQYSQLLSIMPQTGQLTGSYADRAVDEDGFGRADALEVDVGIDISVAGDYNLTADLKVGSQVIAQSSKVFSATAGIQTVTLRFDGNDIYDAKLDGPYLLTNLVLVDLQVAVPTVMQSDLYTTAPYHYAEFQPGGALYLPLIIK